MALKKKLLLAAMAVGLAGTAGSAFALTYNAATEKTQNGTLDTAVYLYWDSTEATSATCGNISNLRAGVAQYNRLTVAPKSSATVAGTVTVTFDLTIGQDTSLKGFTLSVYSVNALPEADGEAAAVSGLQPAATKAVTDDEDPASVSTNFSITAAADVHETVKYFVLKYVYDGSQMSNNKTFGGGLTISQAFAA